MEQPSATQEMENFKCMKCNQSFRTQEELRDHNRMQHQSMSGQKTGSGAEQQFPKTGRNPGAERHPSMDRDRDTSGGQRKSPGSEQGSEQQGDRESETRQTRKRAAS